MPSKQQTYYNFGLCFFKKNIVLIRGFNMGMETIDRDLITLPIIRFTSAALAQLNLIIENDFTLAGKYLRVLISGKGCDGFTYSVGFTDLETDDFLVPIENEELEVVIDPFTAFYLNETTVDYVQDFINNNEGFTVENSQQDNFKGKFWRENKELIPPQI